MNIATTIQTLYQQYGLLSGITIECQNDLVAIGVRNKAATAEVFIQGAQLTRYQRIGESPLLFLSDKCLYQQGHSLRGGIPICWPWFGALDKNPEKVTEQFIIDDIPQAPAHGFIRDCDWKIESITLPSDQLTIVELSYDIGCDGESNSHQWWPFSTQLRYRIEIGESLSATLSVKNTGDKPFAYSNALHTYFSVSHIDHVQLKGLDQLAYVDTLINDQNGQWVCKTQQGNMAIDQEVDRIYSGDTSSLVIKDKAIKSSDRAICVDSRGSQSVVVWNPWADQSKHLSQFADDDYLQMICIETANVLDDCVELMPDQEHQLQLMIR